ncbi:UDP-N-acetylglucosamine 2-epimerase [Candidatus Nitrosocosmicus arcticus]|nr:UDP-N-acetylglucosamine 2-epimerase [Candidatus Nitrosocosmicus arcticus]
MKTNLLPVLKAINHGYVVIYSDTDSNMAAALAAEDIPSKIIHVEAEVRDFDLHVPEEPLWIQIDEMSDYFFPPSNFCTTVLSYENTRGKIFTTANLIVDVCKDLLRIAISRKLSESLPQEYLLSTLHRPENVDNPHNLRLLMNHIAPTNHPVVFPVHPRTKKNLQHFNIGIPSNITIIDPLGYMDFLS